MITPSTPDPATFPCSITATDLLRELDVTLTTLQNLRSVCAEGCDLPHASAIDDAARVAITSLLLHRRPLMLASTAEEALRLSTPPK